MASLQDFLGSVETAVANPEPEDPILECGEGISTRLASDPERTLQLANDKLHVFPFKDVKTCWRRLYTDSYLLLAAKAARSGHARRESLGYTNGISNDSVSRGQETRPCGGSQAAGAEAPSPPAGSKRKAEQVAAPGSAPVSRIYGHSGSHKRLRTDRRAWLTECVEHLDMALIVAGGCMREDLIEAFLSHLDAVHQEDNETEVELPQIFARSALRPPDIEHPVAQRDDVTLAQFQSHLNAVSALPLLLKGSMTGWEALNGRPWNRPSYLLSRTLGGRRLVPIELGRSYTDEGWGQKIVPFGDFLRSYIVGADGCQKSQQADLQAHPREEQIAYLAQHDLFMQIPSLRNDICIPDYCYTDPPPPAPGTPLARKAEEEGLPKPDEPQLNAWFGPAGTVSPLHTDPYHNILCQVVGQKYVRLYSPHETERLKPRGMENGIDMSNTSSVPTEVVEMGGMVADDPSAWEDFEEAEYCETLLSPGESLYIPVGWWHYVRSLTVSFSVSFWWN